MRTCEDHELALSTLLDGESDPGELPDLLEHLSGCARCHAFFRDARRLQVLAEALAPAPAAPAKKLEPRRRSFSRPVVLRWTLGLAATIALVFVAGHAGWFGDLPAGVRNADDEVVIRLGDNAGRMDDRRFIAIVDELLTAAPRYREGMQAILNTLPAAESGGESLARRLSDKTNETETLEGADITAMRSLPN